MRTDQELAAYVGFDWGDQRHAVQLQPAAGGPVEQLELEQRPHVLHGWVAQLRERFSGRPVGIAIEQRRGAVIHALMQYEFLVLYPVNPKALARYREAFHPSGAKDDPTDAALLLDLLRKHRDQLRPWHPDTVTARQLQLLCEHRRKLVNLRGGLTNRITSLLKQYFPQALDWVGTLDSRLAWNTVARWLERAAAVCRRFSDGRTTGFVATELQADEIRSFTGGKTRPTWVFVAIEVGSRLWTSTAVGRRSYRNTLALVRDVAARMAFTTCPLIVTDGFEFYGTVIRRIFGPAALYAQVIKTRRHDRVVRVERRAVIGAAWRFDEALTHSEDSSTVNTSFIERLNLTIRQSSAYLSRRTLSHARATARSTRISSCYVATTTSFARMGR